jgi:hypothetical protein
MNIRWDAVVDRAAVAGRQAPPLPPGDAIDGSPTNNIQVRVQLFGALAAVSRRQSIELTLPADATLAGLIAMLGDQLGEAFLAHVLDASGAKRRHCRLFVAGYPVEDLQAPLHPANEPTEIDIILLVAPEGG